MDCIKHRYSGLVYHANTQEELKGPFDLVIAARGAVAALTQNCTHPADVNAAVSFLLNGLKTHENTKL